MNVLNSRARSRPGAAVFALLLASQLAACGGGGSGGGSSGETPPPAGSNPPANPPADPAPVAKSKLRLSGRVTDQPIPNAQVTATIGTQTFTATADANGDYNLDIEIEQTQAGGFVTLTARGTGAQSFVEFTSLAGYFQSLLEKAGDDEVLSSSENFATQITNVSTAEAVMLQQANGGTPVTSEATMKQLAASVNAQDVLDLAAAIKLAVDEPETYPLPEGQTVLSLAQDTTARQTFINDVYTQDPAAFAAMQAAIVNDATLTRPIAASDVKDFTAALLSDEPGFSFNYLNRVSMFTFETNGTGFVTGANYDQPMTWAIEGSKINIAYAQPVVTYSYDMEMCDGQKSQIQAEYVSTGTTVAFLSDRTVAITETNNIRYPAECNLASRELTSTVARTVLSMDDLMVIDMEEKKGNSQTIYVWDAVNEQIVADIADINADNTGVARLTNQTFTWQLDETGKIVQVTFANGATAEYMSLRDIDELASDLFWEVRTPNDGPVYTDIGASVFGDPEYALDFSTQPVSGRLYQFGIGNETDDDARLKGFRLRFDQDQTGAHEDDEIIDGQLVTVSDATRADFAFRWDVDGADLVVSRTFDTDAGEYNNCVVSATCVEYDERRLTPLGAEDSGPNVRVYVLEQRRLTDPDNTVTETRLVRFYDLEPLASGTGFAKPTVAPAGSKARALLKGRSQK